VKRRVAKVTIVAALLVGLSALGPVVLSPEKSPMSGGTPMGIGLALPAFAQSAGLTFPTSEAGMSAYANAGASIDMAVARTLFAVIEDVTETYVIGTVMLPGHKEDMWPHAYIGKDGWLLVYFPKTEPASKCVQWYGYQRDIVTTTTLRDVLVSLGRGLGLDQAKIASTLGYCHFQHPNATKLLIVVDTEDGSDSFKYTIPSGIRLDDAAWSHYAGNIQDWGSSQSTVDGTELFSGGTGTYEGCGSMPGEGLTPDISHVANITKRGSGWVGLAIVFLYH
jgi:hypothetical protein